MPPIAVTGAGGYIAGFIVEQLLQQGHTVHGTVRDPTAQKNAFLKKIAEANPQGVLKLFAADLELEGSFDEAIRGCEIVIHTAAVVKNHYDKDPLVEVVNPVVAGARNVLSSCQKAGVRRIVYTSSSGTILSAETYRDEKYKGLPFTEDQWISHVSPTYGTYNFAKIAAEKYLESTWGGEFISILPSWTIGPLQHNELKSSSSQAVIKAVVSKQFGKLLTMRMFIHWVDVRDVAAAHVFGAMSKSLPNGRYNCAGPANVSTSIIAETFNKIDESLKLPTAMLPWGLMWTASWFDKRLTSHLLYEKAVPAHQIDSSKIVKAGFVFQHNTSLEDTLRATLASYRAHGIIA